VGVARVTWPNFQILGPPYNFWKNRDARFKFGTDIEDGPYCVRIIKRPQSVRGLGHVTKFEILEPLITLERIDICFGTNRDICFKSGTDKDDGPLLHPDHNDKMTPKWTWPGSRDRILHSKDELITCQLCYIKGKWYVYYYKNKTASKYKRQKLKVYNDV